MFMNFQNDDSLPIKIKIESAYSLTDFQDSPTIKEEVFREVKKEIISLDENDEKINPILKKAKLDLQNVMTVKKTSELKTYLDFLICNENEYECSICGVSKTRRKSILFHLKCHDEVPTFSCDFCDEKFFFQLKYEEHISKHRNLHKLEFEDSKNSYLCEICGASFKLSCVLDLHKVKCHSESN